MLECFRSYLIIISKSTRLPSLTSVSNEFPSPNLEDTITVLDIHNKFIVYQYTMPSLKYDNSVKDTNVKD